MAGGSERHDLIAGLIDEAVASGARATGRRPFMANRLIRTKAGSAYYPDVMVVCGPAAHRPYDMNPTLVVEVLSRSTEDVDWREKGAGVRYKHLDPSVRARRSRSPRIEIASPSADSLAWIVLGPGDVLDTGYGVIELDALYDELDDVADTHARRHRPAAAGGLRRPPA